MSDFIGKKNKGLGEFFKPRPTKNKNFIEEQIKILNDERLRLVEGVNAGILSSESFGQRMLAINKTIENMIKNKDKNPFDKMFPGQSLALDKNPKMAEGGEASFPDLSGDGKVTQKDILMGRGVIKKANGGEIDMALQDVSSGTMDMQPSQQEMAAVQQIMDMVSQMMQAGASEEEIIAALKEMGLDDQDIAMVMQAIMQQGQQQTSIDSELSQMM